MPDHRFSEHIEGMLDVMLCLPRRAWGFVLVDVDKKIGTGELHDVILRACHESDSRMSERFKRIVALFNRQEKRKHSGERRKAGAESE